MSRKTEQCKECDALMYEDESIHHIGLRCGCLKKYVNNLKKEVKENKQRKLF